MPVYVDKLAAWATGHNLRWAVSCHMIADTPAELHAMAKQLHLPRTWFQEHTLMPHYNLTATKRHLAVFYGAIEIDWYDLIQKCREFKRGTKWAPLTKKKQRR